MANLVTLKETKDYMGIVSTEQDTKIKNLILYVSDFIKLYCGRVFIDNYANSAYTNITEYWSGGFNYYYTKEFPLRSLVSVSISVDLGTTYTTLTSGIDYAIDMEKDRIYIAEGDVYSGVNTYKFVYTGGFAVTPDSLKVAVFDLIQYYLKDQGVPRKTSGSVSIEYIRSSDLPYHIKRVLDLYRVIE
jgi:hypothetical protein